MSGFMKKNKKLIIIGGVAGLLAILVVLGFVANSAANSYLKTYNEEAEKLFQNPDALNMSKNGGFALVKKEVQTTPKAPADEGKKGAEALAAPKKTEELIPSEISPVSDDVAKKFDEAAKDDKKTVTKAEISAIVDYEISPSDKFTYLGKEKIGHICKEVPSFFAKIGIFFGLGGPYDIYDSVKIFAEGLKKITESLKKDSFVVALVKDKKGTFYSFEKKEGADEFKVKSEERVVKDFKDPKAQQTAAAIANVILVAASEKEEPKASS